MKDIIEKSNLNSLTVLLLILVFAHPLLYWGELRDASSLPRYALLAAISGIGISVWAIITFFNKKQISIHVIYIPIIIIFLWSALSLSWSVDPKNAVIELIQFLGLTLISFLISQVVTRERLVLMVIASTISASIVALIGVQQYFHFNPFNFVQYSQPGSTFTVTNLVSIYLDLIVFVAFMLFITSESKYAQWFFALCFSLILTFLLLSRTRGSWLGLLFSFVIFVILLYKNQWLKDIFIIRFKNKKILTILSLIMPIVLLNLSGGSYKEGYAKLTYDASAGIRLTAYVNSLSMINDKPLLGTGVGGFRVGFRPYMFANLPLNHVNEDINLLRLHNDPLQFIVELGIPVGLFISFIGLFIMVLIWQVIKKEKTDIGKLIFIGVFLSLLASGLHSLVDFPLRKPSSAIQLSLWVGAFIGLHSQYYNSKKIVMTKVVFTPLLIMLVGYIVIVFLFYSNYITSNMYLKQARISFLNKNCEKAKKQIRIGNEIFGLDYLSQSRLVQFYSFCNSTDIERLKVMDLAIEYDSNNSRARLTRGNLYLSLGESKKAKIDFGVIIKILPNRTSGYIGMGDVSVFDKEFVEAKNYYNQALLKIKNKSDANFREMNVIETRLKNIKIYLQ